MLPAIAQPSSEDREPVWTELVEETGVALTLLEVEARDKQDRPLPGLTKDDFTLILNGRVRPLYSVDDLCPVGPEEPGVAPDTEQVERPESPQSADDAGKPAVSEARNFVLYFDFSHFRMHGRFNALEAAERWLRESFTPPDRAEIVGYTSMHGLRMFSEFTADRDGLLETLDAMRDDVSLVDPFPEAVDMRVYCCTHRAEDSGCLYSQPTCREWAFEAYLHNSHGLKALRNYVVSLETIPGPKALLYFQQDGAIFPSRPYGVDEGCVGDVVNEMDSVGAEANLSRTTIYSVQTGDFAEPRAGEATNFGANLADFTGGGYNHNNLDLDSFLEGAGRGRRCTYLLAIERPPHGDERLLRAKVLVRNRALAGRYRVRFLDGVDRWWRNAQAVLSAPERATDVRLIASVLPTARNRKGWNVRLRVAVDVGSLATIPWADVAKGDWEIGALLNRTGTMKSWEMLGVARLRTRETIDSAIWVVHERELTGLSPGDYRLAAFARDRLANLFGGAESELALPASGGHGIAGPFVMLASQPYLSAPLPLFEHKKKNRTPPTAGAPLSDRIPAGREVVAGESLDLVTILCADSDRPAPADGFLRYVTRDDEALFRFEPAALEAAGDCRRCIDRVETGALEPGDYAYHVWWKNDDGEEPLEAQAAFRVMGR
jgi:VWFA-related protein